VSASIRQLQALEKVGRPTCKAADSGALSIVAFSDYRVQDISHLFDFLGQLKSPPNVVLYAGDDLERFQDGKQNLFEKLAETATHGLCAVVGNDTAVEEDSPKRIHLIGEAKKARSYIRGENVHNVHCSPLIVGDYAIIGNEGSVSDDTFGALGTVIYPEASVLRHLRMAAKAVAGKHIIVVSHTPPRGVRSRP
jgi:hypothetical protein